MDQGIIADLDAGTVSCGSETDTLTGVEAIRGTAYDDSFTGDDGWVNVFFDGGGSDTINGGSVHDPEADTGFDIASYEYAGSGITATMTGTSGSVVTDGGTDTLTDIDMIWGSHYDDLFYGDQDTQEFMPGEGNDMVDGGGSEDADKVTYWKLDTGVAVNWDAGNGCWTVSDAGATWTDTLISIEEIEGSAGNDTFTGGDGDDFFSGWGGANEFIGGNGTDTVSYEEDPGAIEVVMGDGFVVNGWGKTDSLTEIEVVVGSNYDDTFGGTSGVDVFHGGEGADEFDNILGRDSLYGDDGDDVFRFYQNAASGTVIDGGDGADELVVEGGIINLTTLDALDNIETLSVGDSCTARIADTLINNRSWALKSLADSGSAALAVILIGGDMSGGEADLSNLNLDNWSSTDLISIFGTSNMDQVSGSDHGEYVEGGGDTDILAGNGGNDTLLGGTGDDVLMGGDGDDVLMPYGGLDTNTGVNGAETIEGGAGSDTLTDSTSVDFSNMTISDVEVIAATDYVSFTFGVDQFSGSDFTVVGGADSNLTILGTSGDDVLDLSGTDFSNMYGNWSAQLGDGDDVFIGSPNDDMVAGGTGQDTLQGMDGDDTLLGGQGADRFVYQYGAAINLSTNGDTIQDFEQGTDMIMLTGDLADTPLHWYGGDSSPYDGIINGESANQPVLVFDPQNNQLYYDDHPLDNDASWQGVVATFSTGSISFNDVFAQGTTITNPGGDINWAGTASGEAYTGTSANERLFGDGGDDTLNGGEGNDAVIGGSGVDSLEGGAGEDTVGFNYDPGGVQVDLSTNQATDGWGNTETITGFEHAVGSTYGDLLMGDGGGNMLFGMGGNDYLVGNGGLDTLGGGTGSDTFAFTSLAPDNAVISDFNAAEDCIGLDSSVFTFFSGGVFDTDHFCSIAAASYDGVSASFGNGYTAGIVYVSNGTSGELWYESDTSANTSAGDYLLALVSEVDGSLSPADQDITSDCIAGAIA